MRVDHVIASVAHEASGPSYSVVRLCESLLETGVDTRLAALDWAPISTSPSYLKTFSLGSGPRRLGTSPSMRRWLEGEVSSGHLDLIHNHGLWMMPNVYAGRACRLHPRCGLIVSPRGMLSRWSLSRKKTQKKIFWRLLQGPAVRNAACFHATSQSEHDDIRRLGFRQPVCVVPNGVDVPPHVEASANGRRQLLFLGRIHPVKGVDLLLRAWAVVEDRFEDWDLHIAGPTDGGYFHQMQALATELRLKRVIFRGALYGREKLGAYQTASLFVLPTHSENFGMVVAEALAAATPAIVTTGAPWPRLADEGAGWRIEIGVDPLVACLQEALGKSSVQLSEMGLSGRRWMTREYSWPRIAAQLVGTYLWLTEGGSQPDWVTLN